MQRVDAMILNACGNGKKCRWITALAICICLAAGNARSAGECGTGFVEAVGEAAILVDPVTARDRALIDARAKAAGACGILVEGHSVVNMGMTLDHFARITTFAFIKAHEIIKEWKAGGIYYVKIKAWVKKGGERKKARKELLSSRLVLMLEEGKGAEIIELIMKERLTSAGFSLLDSDLLKTKVSPETWQCLLTGNSTCLDEDFYPFLADYLVRIKSGVRFSQDVAPGMKSFRARSEIACTQISSAKMSAYAKKTGIIFGIDEEKAVCGAGRDQFKKAVAEPLSAAVIQKLSRLFAARKRQVRITIRDLPSREAFENFRLLVKELRWVSSISSENFLNGTGTLLVPYSEKSVYLASMIAFREIYKITRYTWGTIDVAYRARKD